MYSVQAATQFLNAGYGVYSLLPGTVRTHTLQGAKERQWKLQNKSPRPEFAIVAPPSPKFNVELASVCQRSALRGTDRPSNPSEKSTLSFGGRGLLFCRTRSRQFLLCICLSTRDNAKTKAASPPKTKPTAQLH